MSRKALCHARTPPLLTPAAGDTAGAALTVDHRQQGLVSGYLAAALAVLGAAGAASSGQQPPETSRDLRSENEELWESVQERAPLHAAVVRYMRFGADPDILGSRSLLGEARSDPVALQAPATSPPVALQALLQSRIRTREHLLRHSEEVLQAGPLLPPLAP